MVRWNTGEVKPPLVVREGKWVPRDPNWFAEARFGVITATAVGQFVREVKVEKFLVEPVAKK